MKYRADIPAAVTKSADSDTYTAILWKSGVDRLGDEIEAAEFQTEAFMQNPIVLAHHKHNSPVGRATEVWHEGDELRAKFEFGSSAKAQEIKADVDAKILNAVSVGFRWLNTRAAELLEFSIVSVPANRNALIVRAMPETTEEDGMSEDTQTQQTPTGELRTVAAPPTVPSETRSYNLGAALAAQAGLDGIDAGRTRTPPTQAQSSTQRTSCRNISAVRS